MIQQHLQPDSSADGNSRVDERAIADFSIGERGNSVGKFADRARGCQWRTSTMTGKVPPDHVV